MNNFNHFFVRCFVVALLIFSPVTIYSQRKAPGYMGKRFTLLYEQGFSWSFGKTIRGIPNLFYTLSGDYAISKKHSFGVEYSFRTRYYGSKYNRYALGENFQLERSMVHKVGIYSKMFSQRNGHIAPAGPYLIVGVHLHFIQSNFLAQSEWTSEYTIRDKTLTFDVAPFIGGGKQYILGKKLMLDVSMRVSLPFVAIVRNLNGEIGDVLHVPTEEKQYNRGRAVRSATPNLEANILELRIGFGGVL